VHQQKLRVTYLPPEGQVLEEEDENVRPPISSVPNIPSEQNSTFVPNISSMPNIPSVYQSVSLEQLIFITECHLWLSAQRNCSAGP